MNETNTDNSFPNNNDTFNAGIAIGIILTILVIIFANAFFNILNGNICAKIEEDFTNMEIRVMDTEEIGLVGGTCRLITDRGFVLWHDDILYIEAAQSHEFAQPLGKGHE